MPEWTSTADLVDRHGDALEVCTLPLRSFGGHRVFRGRLATVRCREDNALLRSVLSEPGEGRVLVVDGGGATRVALVGDIVAGLAVANGWAGLVLHAMVRDSAALAGLPIGVLALGTSPAKSAKTGAGERDQRVSFGGATFTPGREVVVDPDGVVVLPATATGG